MNVSQPPSQFYYLIVSINNFLYIFPGVHIDKQFFKKSYPGKIIWNLKSNFIEKTSNIILKMLQNTTLKSK